MATAAGPNRHHLSEGVFAGKFNGGHEITTLVCHCGHASLLHKQSAVATAAQMVDGAPSMPETCPTEPQTRPLWLAWLLVPLGV